MSQFYGVKQKIQKNPFVGYIEIRNFRPDVIKSREFEIRINIIYCKLGT